MCRARTQARLLDALESPAVPGASEDHTRRVTAPAGHEMRAVLLDPRPVIHQHQSQVLVVPTRPRLPKSISRGRLESGPVPSLIRGTGMLERAIGIRDVGADLSLMRGDVPAAGDVTANEQHEDERAKDYENDAERGHGSRV